MMNQAKLVMIKRFGTRTQSPSFFLFVGIKCFFKFSNPFMLCQLEDNEIIPPLLDTISA